MRENILATLKNRLNPHRTADKEWYLSLLDEEKQFLSEKEHICNVLLALKKIYILRIQNKISEIKREYRKLNPPENIPQPTIGKFSKKTRRLRRK